MSQLSPLSAVALRRKVPGQPFAMVLGWLCLTAVAAFFWGAPFWTLPNLFLNASAAAVTIDLINMGVNHSVYLANHTTGWLRSPGLGDDACLLFFATCYILGGVVVSFVKKRGGAMVPLAPPNPQMS
jgi:hypothetical protein